MPMDRKNPAMEETWTETATFSTEHSRRRGESERPDTCDCGLRPVMRISQTDKNPGRRFWRCSSPRGLQCEYYYWIDPEVAAPVKEYVVELKARIKALETGVARSQQRINHLVMCTAISWLITLGVVCFLV